MSTQADTGQLQRFSVGDDVQIVVPPQSRAGKYKDMMGTVTNVINDYLGEITGDPRDSYCYVVEFEDGAEFKARDSDLQLEVDN